jgi:cytochrome P450
MIGMSYPESLPLSSGVLPVKNGNLLEFPEDPIACMRKLHCEFGDMAVLEDQGQRIAFVFSPEFNREVLSNSNTYHSQFFAIRGSRRSAQRTVTSGLLSMNGTEHRDSRRVMMDVFTRRILPEYHDTITSLTEELMADWQVGQQHDLNTEMVHFMLRMTSALLFGIDDAQYSVELGSKIDSWVRKNHEVGMGALVSAPQFTDMYDELLTMADDLQASIQEMFFRHRENHSEGQRSDVLSLMFKAQGSEQQLDDNKLVGHATLTFAAAHLTTAHTFSWTLFLLAQHPEVMNRLSRELAERTTGSQPTFEELQNCTYLEWVIKESMRVLPASSYSQRITTEQTQLGPVSLPQGTPVIFSQFMTHHRADLFEDPDAFRPERWEHSKPSAYEYLPFGAGPRMCIGAPLAMLELRTALAVIAKRFHFQVQADSVVNGQVISTMLGPTSSVEATLLPVTQSSRTVPVNGSIHDLVQLPAAAQPQTLRRAA